MTRVCTTPASRPMRRTSQPRSPPSRNGWRRSARCRRTGGSSPTTKTAPRAPSSTGPVCKPRSTSPARQDRPAARLPHRPASRKVRQLASIAEELDKLNVVLRSATEPFDTGSAAGRMMLQCSACSPSSSTPPSSTASPAGIERRAREGRWPNGRIPFGYARNEQKQLVPDERTAPVIRRIFTRYAAGRLGAAAIARRLGDEHAPAPSRAGTHIVLWMLSNEAYVGRVHWRDQTFPGLHEPLIDQNTFDRAQALLKQRGEDLAMRAASRADFLLTGLVRCGRCRRAYVGMSAKGTAAYHYYACSGRQKLGAKAATASASPARS